VFNRLVQNRELADALGEMVIICGIILCVVLPGVTILLIYSPIVMANAQFLA
jgi:hypothetical protein